MIRLAAVLAVTLAPVPAPVFTIADERITEASGLAVGIRSPDVVYVQNDSGDSARFFAVDARTGRTRAVYTVPGAQNVDWEDLAVARDSRGVASVWLADIGDNDAARTEVRVYRVDEPGAAGPTSAPDVWRLRYPGGPADAESLAVAPGGRAWIVTKSLTGASRLYEVPRRPDAGRVQALLPAGSIRFTLTGTAGGPNLFGQLTATGASISADGAVLAIRTYTDAYLWPLTGGNVAAAIRTTPVRIALPPQPQGEGIAIDGRRLLIDTEGTRSGIVSVPLPTLSAPGRTTPRTSAPGTSAPPPARSEPSRSQSHAQRYGVIAALSAAAALAGAVALGRRRSERRVAAHRRRQDP